MANHPSDEPRGLPEHAHAPDGHSTSRCKHCLEWMFPGEKDFCSSLCRSLGAAPVAPRAPRVPTEVGPPPAGVKLTNPKDAIGCDKLPLHLWPETATAMGCLALLEGAVKYGRLNWRAVGVRVSIYIDACKRHLNAYFEGQDIDPDSGLPHLAKALACLAILVDADAAGQLNDDRQFPGGYPDLVTQLTPHVARLKALHAEKKPRHYTIADDVDEVMLEALGSAGSLK